MTATLALAPSSSARIRSLAPPASPLRLERRHWLAALAVVFVFFAPYQTLVQTVITDDAVRKGVDVDSYDETWVTVSYVVGLLYGAFTGLWLSARIGARYTIALGLLGFALGALLTGAACIWWLSALDNFTAKEHVTVILACWGAFLGLIPPAFLTDEVEGLNPKDSLYASTLGTVGLVVPLLTVPTATGTMVKIWSDRAEDTYRLNLSSNRPAVPQAADRIGGYYRRRGLSGPAGQQQTRSVLGTFATVESTAVGFQWGLRFPSLMMLTLGLTAALLLWRAARNLHAPPGAGYT